MVTDSKRGEKSERLILEELRRHSDGVLISRPMLKEGLCLGRMSERTLDRALERLRRKGLIIKLTAADRASFFGIAEETDRRESLVESVGQLGKRGITKRRIAASRGKSVATTSIPVVSVTPERMIENYERLLERDIDRYKSRPHRERIRKIAEQELAKLKRQVDESKRSP